MYNKLTPIATKTRNKHYTHLCYRVLMVMIVIMMVMTMVTVVVMIVVMYE